MHEYDTVELVLDHPELTPALPKGTRGVIVDLPEDSSLAAVEFALPGEIEVFLLEREDLRLVNAAGRGYDTSQD